MQFLCEGQANWMGHHLIVEQSVYVYVHAVIIAHGGFMDIMWTHQIDWYGI